MKRYLRHCFGVEPVFVSKMSDLSSDDLVNLLLCPVCLGTVRGEVKSCINGHIFCEMCSSRMKLCPSCRVKLIPNRCLVAEKLRDKLHFECEFKDRGCNVKLTWSELALHKEFCPFAPVTCPICKF